MNRPSTSAFLDSSRSSNQADTTIFPSLTISATSQYAASPSSLPTNSLGLAFLTELSGSVGTDTAFPVQPLISVNGSSDFVSLSAYLDSGCSIPGYGILSNSMAVFNSSGFATFTSLSYSRAEVIYLKVVSGNASMVSSYICTNGSIVIGSGDVVVSELNTNRIRLVKIATGQVTTLAGSGVGSNVDGLGTAATFDRPRGIGISPSGLVYVSCVFTFRSLNVTTANVTTLAGKQSNSGLVDGVGQEAHFVNPFHMAFVSSELVVVADSISLRLVNVITRNVTTFVGSGASSGPYLDGVGTSIRCHSVFGVAVSSSTGLVYFTDNQAIRSVNMTTANVTTVFGTLGVIGFENAMGMAAKFNYPTSLSFLGNSLVIADSNNTRIRIADPNSLSVTTLAGSGGTQIVDGVGSSATFFNPTGIAVYSSSIVVADCFNRRIRLIDSSQSVTTVAGFAGIKDGVGADALFDYPTGVAYDRTTDLLVVTDYLNSVIRSINLTTFNTTTIAGSGFKESIDGVGTASSFNNPYHSTVSSSGLYFVADSYGDRIRQVNRTSGLVSTIAGSGVPGSTDGVGKDASFWNPFGVAAFGDSDLLAVADRGNNMIRLINTTTMNVTTIAGNYTLGSTDGFGLSARFNTPYDVAVTSYGLVVVCDRGNHAIRTVNITNGNVTTLAGGSAGNADGIGKAAKFNTPSGIGMTADNLVIVADLNNNLIRLVSITTGEVTTLAGKAGFSGRFDGIGLMATFYKPFGVTASPAGVVYVADQWNSLIRAINITTANVTTIAGSYSPLTENGIGSAAGFHFPSAVGFV